MPLLASWLADDEIWLSWAMVCACVALAMFLEQRYRIAARISGPVIVLLMGLAATDLQVLSPASPVFTAIGSYAVPICIPLLLLRANLLLILRRAGSLFGVFHIAAFGSMVGGFLAYFVMHRWIGDAAEIAGIMTGSYVGGSVNFSGLSQLYADRMDRSILGPLVVADNLVMAAVFFLCFALPSSRWVQRFYGVPRIDPSPSDPRPEMDAEHATNATEAAKYWRARPISLLHIATAMALAVGIAAISQSLANVARTSALPPALVLLLNPFLISATLCVVIATLAADRLEQLAGTQELGTWLIYLFFFQIGTEASIARLWQQGGALFLFCGIMALTNVVVTLGLGRIFRCRLEEVSLAINAALGGAPSAAAMAIAKGWPNLVLPAVLIGVWGYILGQWCGIAVAEVLFAWNE